MSSSDSLHNRLQSPKKSSICSSKSADSEGDAKGVDKEPPPTIHKQGSKKDKSGDKRSDDPTTRLTSKPSTKHLVKTESFKLHSNNKGEQVPKKFISTWRMACDKTKDRTKELLKKWRTVPEGGSPNESTGAAEEDHGWSVHVWTTWVKRFPSDDDAVSCEDDTANTLTPVQTEKLSHLFSNLLDTDRDDVISVQDFDSLIERLRHFADWSINSVEYLTLLQVHQGLVHTFLLNTEEGSWNKTEQDGEERNDQLERIYVDLDHWLATWSRLLQGVKAFYEFPIWLQYLAKLLFQLIHTAGSGQISREELRRFYISVMGLHQTQVEQTIDKAYTAMTSGGESVLDYWTYRLVFCNFLLGRFPNGPGQYLFGYEPQRGEPPCFPVDYTAMNTPPRDLERYSPDSRSDRRSVVV